MKYKVHAQGPGIGDALWLTALARNFKAKRPNDDMIIVSSHPSLFKNNPDVYGAISSNTLEPTNSEIIDVRLQFNPPIHAIDGYCQQLDIEPPYTRKNFIYLTESEVNFANKIIPRGLAIIAVQSQAGPWSRGSKDWLKEYYEEVIYHFTWHSKYRYKFLQIGGMSDTRLEGCQDFRGTVRETAAILKKCIMFLGPISSGMHMASGVDIPALIIFGGRELPDAIALQDHRYLYSKTNCSPCWLVEPCPFGKLCMKDITPDVVIKTMEEML